jgi:orotidine-5'-phosphate decarboxylase
MDFLNEKRGIILAADVTSLEGLVKLSLLAEQHKEVVAIKIGCLLTLRFDLSMVMRIIQGNTKVPVIYDHQKAGTDIPAMGEPFAEALLSKGISAEIIFPLAGPQTLRAYVEGAQKFDIVPIVGLVMTHGAFLHLEGGYIVNHAPKDIRQQAALMGVKNFVMPATKLHLTGAHCEALEKYKPVKVMMPGIGTQGGQLQKAFSAVEDYGHHPFAIIGSAIYKAENPEEALQGFIKEMGEV